MALPGDILTITVTGAFADGSGHPLGGTVMFWPSAELSDAAGKVIIGMTPIVATVSPSTGQFSQVLACTDSPDLRPAGWTWKIQVAVAGAAQVFNAYIPSSYGSTVDLSALGPVAPLPSLTGPYVVSVNGQSGTVTALAPTVVFPADAATISVNAAAGTDFRVTLGGNRTLGSPANPADGQRIIFQVTQDSTGSRTLAYGTAYEFSAQLPQPTLSTAPGDTDLLGFIYNAAKGKWFFTAFLGGF